MKPGVATGEKLLGQTIDARAFAGRDTEAKLGRDDDAIARFLAIASSSRPSLASVSLPAKSRASIVRPRMSAARATPAFIGWASKRSISIISIALIRTFRLRKQLARWPSLFRLARSEPSDCREPARKRCGALRKFTRLPPCKVSIRFGRVRWR